MAKGSDLSTAHCNHDTSSGPRDVGQGKPNNKGLYDMLGNMWEWVYDSYIGSYSEKTKDDRYRGYVENDSNRVLRGGGWLSYASNECRPTARYQGWAFNRYYWLGNVGLRLVIELKSNR